MTKFTQKHKAQIFDKLAKDHLKMIAMGLASKLMFLQESFEGNNFDGLDWEVEQLDKIRVKTLMFGVDGGVVYIGAQPQKEFDGFAVEEKLEYVAWALKEIREDFLIYLGNKKEMKSAVRATNSMIDLWILLGSKVPSRFDLDDDVYRSSQFKNKAELTKYISTKINTKTK